MKSAYVRVAGIDQNGIRIDASEGFDFTEEAIPFGVPGVGDLYKKCDFRFFGPIARHLSELHHRLSRLSISPPQRRRVFIGGATHWWTSATG